MEARQAALGVEVVIQPPFCPNRVGIDPDPMGSGDGLAVREPIGG